MTNKGPSSMQPPMISPHNPGEGRDSSPLTLLTGLSGTTLDSHRPPWEDSAEKRYPPFDPSKLAEYDKIYPPDQYGEELGANARVFKVYRDRVTEKDENLVKGWHDTLNVILIFAALFSAILTGFLVEASKQLKPDNTETTARAVIAVLARLEGLNGSSSISLSAPFVPDCDSKWINGLWFTSLVLALIVSLLAILANQWLLEYSSTMRSPAGDAQKWAVRHVALSRGLSDWGVGAFISWLAVLLHVALFLFLAGLSVFLSSLNRTVYIVISTLSAAATALYIAAILAPFWWPECPSRTPFHRQLEWSIPRLLAFSEVLFWTIIWSPAGFMLLFILTIDCVIKRDFTGYLKEAKRLFLPTYSSIRPRRHANMDQQLVSSTLRRFIATALNWIMDPENRLPDSDIGVAVDALGALDLHTHTEMGGHADLQRAAHAVDKRSELLGQTQKGGGSEFEAAIGRGLRAWIVAQRPVDRDTATRLSLLRSIRTHDVAILADILISHYEPHQLSMPDTVVHLALSSILRPEETTFQIVTQQLGMLSESRCMSFPIFNIIAQKSVSTTIMVVCTCSPELVDVTLAQLPERGVRFQALLHKLRSYVEPFLPHSPWQVSVTCCFAWAVEHSDDLDLQPDDVQAIQVAYRSILRFMGGSRLAKLTDIEHSLMPFATRSEFVQSCTEAEVNSACAMFCDALKAGSSTPSWSRQLGNIMLHLMERQADLGGTSRFMKSWPLKQHFLPDYDIHNRVGERNITHTRMDRDRATHKHVIEGVKAARSIESFLQATPLDVLRQRTTTGSEKTSIWRCYLSMGQDYDQQRPKDTHAGSIFAIQLALLLRAGLETSHAKVLLHELAGDGRGIRLFLGDEASFIVLATHAKTVDPEWWEGMRRQLLALPLNRWRATQKMMFQRSSSREMVDEIEGAALCEMCTEALSDMDSSILATRQNTPTSSTPTAHHETTAQGDTIAEHHVRIRTSDVESDSTQPAGGSDEVSTVFDHPVATGNLWRRVVLPIRAVVRLSRTSERRASDLEKQGGEAPVDHPNGFNYW